MTDPAEGFLTITPDDDVVFEKHIRSVYVGTGGDLAVVMRDSSEGIHVNVPDGTVLPIQVLRVLSTGTTADDILGYY